MLLLAIRLYLSTSVATQVRPLSCNQLETRMLVSDWLHLTGLAKVADEADKYKLRYRH